jgi:hypothetical protein
MNKSASVFVMTVFGLVIIFSLSGCAYSTVNPEPELPAAKNITGTEAKFVEKGIEPAISQGGIWPILDIKTEVYPLLVEGEPVGVERKQTTTVLYMFSWQSISQEKIPAESE